MKKKGNFFIHSNLEGQSSLLDSTGTQSTRGIGDAQVSYSTWDSSVSKQSFGSEVSRSLHTVPENCTASIFRVRKLISTRNNGNTQASFSVNNV